MRAAALAATLPLMVGCSSASSSAQDAIAALDAMIAGDAAPAHDATADAAPVPDARAEDAATSLDAVPADSGSTVPTAAMLLALTSACTRVAGTSGLYATDEGEAQTIPVCQLTGAVFWHADMDIDCDGGRTTICRADPAYQPDTSATDSAGNALDAATIPFVVVPLPSTRFDYTAGGLELGSVIAVIYQGQLEYGVFGDEGPDTIIGEASYAMAQRFGIDPDPVNGGADSGITYIAFTGHSGAVTRNEDHDEAQRIGEARAAQLLREN